MSEVEAFFQAYERANAESDIAMLGSLYADTFTFVGPSGVRSVNKDDFLKVIPKRKEYFASLGLVESKVAHVEEIELDAKYVMARTSWKMTFRRGEERKELSAAATYILDDTLTIVIQIDHQDLATRVKELG
jgi:ketosteroid isomerase-like protein